MIENYFAPSLRTSGHGSLADWSIQDIAEFLTTGANNHGIVFGSMTDVIVHSTRSMTDDDALAAARYLKSIVDKGTQTFVYDEAAHHALQKGGHR